MQNSTRLAFRVCQISLLQFPQKFSFLKSSSFHVKSRRMLIRPLRVNQQQSPNRNSRPSPKPLYQILWLLSFRHRGWVRGNHQLLRRRFLVLRGRRRRLRLRLRLRLQLALLLDETSTEVLVVFLRVSSLALVLFRKAAMQLGLPFEIPSAVGVCLILVAAVA